MQKYQPALVEKKWQDQWDKQGLYKTDLSKDHKYYVLAEFAYPSGDLHMGHWFTWGGADIFARFKRLQGYSVFFPNGFDAFGLPAENAAIKRNIHPQDWTLDNIAKMKAQYSTMGATFSFDHEVITCLPNYYKWNQWIFLQMWEKGLAYEGTYLSNWCPSCQTVLANEGVEAGKCWRCGSEVEQKAVDQWFFKITEYADKLLWNKQNQHINWPKAVKEAQNDWIGKSEGMEIEFKLDSGFTIQDSRITVYTVFPETIYGVTYMVLAPEHPLVEQIISRQQTVDSKQCQAVKEYVEQARKKSELERKAAEKAKTGVFTGLYCINPANDEKVPIWVGDYVIASYGTGAVMGVPGSDHRDFAFAKTYSLPIRRVIGVSANDNSEVKTEQDVLEEGILVNSAQFNGLKSPSQARNKIKDWLEQQGFGKRVSQYHIHDWSVSRQRYWGTPVPVIHCPKCGTVPVPYQDLPVELPYDVDYAPHGKPPLASNEKWLKVKCPKCKGPAKRDAETLDTFVDSSWYFFRYLDPELETKAFDIDLASKIMPVDIYFGGAEHTLGHTLYSRFFTKFFKDLKLTDLDEYALRRVNHGIVLGPDGNKMSKSKGNVVNPDEEVKRYGADAVRTYMAFFMPYEGTGPWVSDRVWGTYRFLERVWELQAKVASIKLTGSSQNQADGHQLPAADLYQMHRTIKKVTEDIEAVKFNTAVAALMEWLNYLAKKDQVSREEYQTYLILLAPIAPHITEELWHLLGHPDSVHNQSWPKVVQSALQLDQAKVAVQVNGKVRDIITVSPDSSQEEVVQIAKNSPKVQKFITDQDLKKVVYVSGKVLSLVI